LTMTPAILRPFFFNSPWFSDEGEEEEPRSPSCKDYASSSSSCSL
jgi:hypothetical protein